MSQKFLEQIANGIALSNHPEVTKAAQQFMIDNGFKFSTAGRLVAESACAEWCDNRDGVSVEFKSAICSAILICPEPELNK